MAPLGENEFFAIREWIIQRWPQAGRLTPPQWAAYLEELGGCESDDVWGALHLYFEHDNKYPPSVNRLKTLAGEVAARRRRTVVALPEPATGPVSLEEFRRTHGGRSPSEVFAASLDKTVAP
ncbi:MAG: hypothetical protein ABIJ75_05090 [Actinomycetota bacterium]